MVETSTDAGDKLDVHELCARFRRLYLSAAVECEIDKQGRILIPPGLREHAELDKDVLWAGMGRTAELWAKEHWRAAQQMTEADLATFKAAIAEQFRL